MKIFGKKKTDVQSNTISPSHQTSRDIFPNSSVSTSVNSKNGKLKVVEVNRNILNALNSFSLKSDKVLDFQKALQLPLSSVPSVFLASMGHR